MVKAIIFDLGNTVFNPDWALINEAIKKDVGIPIFLSPDLKKLYNDKVLIGEIPMKVIFEEIIKRSGSKRRLNEVIDSYKKNYKKYTFISGNIIQFISLLKRKYKVYALSNTNEIHTEVNRERGIFNSFDKVFLSFKLGMKKPNEKIYREILKDIKLQPPDIVFIDDNEENIKKASEIGFKTIKFDGFNKLKDIFNSIDIN